MPSISDLPNWPRGDGEMARRIREFPWAATPLGPIDRWPPMLKTIVDLMLGSDSMMAAPWGEQAILLYNDAYSQLIGPRSKVALGRPVFETLPELQSVLEPQFAKVMAGHTVQVIDQPYPFVRANAREDTWFNVSHVPVRGENGHVAGILTTLTETTARVHADQRRDALEGQRATELTAMQRLYALNEHLANETDLHSALEQILEAAVDFTKTDRGCALLVSDDKEYSDVVALYGYAADSPLAEYFLHEGAKPFSDVVRRDRTRLIVDDVATYPGLAGTRVGDVVLADGVRALQATPMITLGGELVGVLTTQFREPHRPTEEQLRLVDLLAWNAATIVERHRGNRTLQEASERQSFLLRLSDALRPHASAEAVTETACRLVVEHLDASRAQYSEVEGDPGAEIGTVRGEYMRAGKPMARRFAMANFGESLVEILRRGEPLVLTNTDTDARITDAQRAALRAVDSPAAISVPLVKEGRLAANFTVHHLAPRDWTDADVQLMQEVADRTWDAVERARAEAALRESEGRYRAVFESIDEGFQILDVNYDENDNLVDWNFVDVNPAYSRMTGIEGSLIGKSIREVIPNLESYWYDIVDRVARTGVAVRMEHPVQELDREFDVYVSRMGGDDSRRIAVVSNDVTARARAEAALRESDERQNFLLKLSDALRAEPNADAVANRAIQMLSEQMKLDRCNITSYRLEDDRADVTHQVGNDRVPPLPDTIRLSDLPAALQATLDRTLVIEDTYERQGLSEAERRNSRSLGMRALVAPTLRKGENSSHWSMVAISASPRRWTRGEIMMVEEVAERTWEAVERARAEAVARDYNERQAFLLELSDALSPLADPVELENTACRLLGKRLGVDRAYYVEVNEAEGYARVSRNYLRGDSPSLAGTFRIEDYGWIIPLLREGRTVVVADTEQSGSLTDANREAMAAVQMAAYISTPIVKAGNLVGALCVTEPVPREWSSTDIELVRETSERIWSSIVSAGAETALRESEERYRTLFDSIDEGFVTVDLIFDETGKAVNCRIVEVNPAFGRMTGIEGDVVGRTTRDILGANELNWYAFLGDVVASDKPCRSTQETHSLGRVFDVFATHVGDENSPRVAIVFNDITRRLEAERLVQESEERYRTLFNSMDEGYCIIEVLFDADGMPNDYRYVEVNPAFAQQTGLTNVVGERMRDLAPEHEASWYDIYGKVVRTGEPVHFVKEARAVGNRTFEVYAYRIGDPSLNQVATLFSDITTRKHTEDALRESEERLRLALSAGEMGTWQYQIATDRNILDESMARLLGLPPDQMPLSFEDFLDKIHVDDREVVRDAFDRAIRETGEVDFEFRALHDDGNIIWLRDRGRVVPAENDRPSVFTGAAMDITLRKRAEEGLRDSEERFRGFAEATTDTLWIIDAKSRRLEYLSPAFERVWGESRDLVMRDLGRWSELLHPDDRNRVADAFLRTLAGENVVTEYRIIRASDGAVRWIRDAGFPIRDDSGVVRRVAGIAQDITDQRRMQEEREAFVDAAAHDLKTPLTSLRGQAQIMMRRMRRGRMTGKDFEAGLKEVDSSAGRMVSVIDEMLDAAHLRADRQLELRLAPVDLVELTRKAVQEAKRATKRHPIRLETKLESFYGEWDRERLTRVLGNLTGNAIKYSPDGGDIVVTLDEEPSADGRPFAVISIRDHGIGIPEGDLSHLFERFRRGANVARIQGTGIGLAGAKQIVEQHGGTLTVSSKEGEGSTFIVRLPVIPEPSAPTTE